MDKQAGYQFAFILCSWSVYCGESLATNSTHQKRLFEALFSEGRYVREIRPAVDDLPTQVHLDLSLISVESVDERRQEFTGLFYHEYSWTDFRLSWNPRHYGGMTYFGYRRHELWHPDLALVNGAEGHHLIGGDFSLVKVRSSGQVVWSLTTARPTICGLDVTYYPFDTQTCSLFISNWLHDDKCINLTFGDVDVSNFRKRGAWSLVSARVSHRRRQGTGYRVTVRRQSTYYVVSVVLPAVFLSVTLPVPFYLPAGSGDKMAVSITTLTTLGVYLSVISDDIPRTSQQTPLFAIYMDILLAMASVCVIMSAVVIRIHNRSFCQDSEGPESVWVILLVRLCHPKKTLVKKFGNHVGPKKDDANPLEHVVKEGDNDVKSKDQVLLASQEVSEDNKFVTWTMVAESIDYVFCVSFISMVALMTTIVFVAMLLID